MLKYVVKRILLTIATLWILFTIMFVVCRLFPDENWFFIYDDPLPVQYINRLKDIITHYDWGICSTGGPMYMPVTQYCHHRIMYTLYTSGVAIVISLVLGFILGIVCAYFDKGFLGTFVNVCALTIGALPCFVTGYALQYFSFRAGGVFPLIMDWGTKLFTVDMLKSVTLPIITLTVGPLAIYIQFIRNSILEDYNSDFVALLRIKGLTKWQIYKKHLIGHALLALLPQISTHLMLSTINLFIVEKMFAIPGAGISFFRSFFAVDRLPEDVSLINSLGIETDYNIFVFYSMFFISVIVVGGLLSDILYGILDPRIRVGTNKNNNY